MPSGMNADCEWPSESASALDIGAADHRRHLMADAKIAEELAIRYADRRHSRRPSRAQWRPTHDACLAKTFEVIASSHHVTAADVVAARARIGDVTLDPLVHLPMALLYVALAWAFIRRVYDRFLPHEDRIALIAILFAGLFISAIAAGFGGLWSAAIEMIRVGNDHMSYRGDRMPWPRQMAALFGIGVVVFWVLAFVQYRVVSRAPGH